MTGAATAVPGSASLRRLGRDTVIYGLGVVLSRAVSFILLPVYTRYLTPADYGLLQLLQMMLDVVAILASAGTTAGVLRFYFKAHDDGERNSVVVTAFLLLACLNLAGALALMPTASLIWKYALFHSGSPALIRIAACNFVLDAFITMPMLLMQAKGRATLYIGSTLGKLFLGLSMNILFVVVLGKGVGGILIGNLLTNSIAGALMVGWMFRQTGFVPSAGAARNLRRFGVPYQFVTAGTFILTFGDRAFLQAFHGLAAVGLYGLAYQFGFMLINLTSAPFFRAWTPHRLQLAVSAPPEVRDEKYNRAFRYLNLFVISAAVGMSLYAWPVLALMSAPQFRPAAAMIPVILAAFVVQIWTDVVTLGIEVSEKTRYATYATWIGAVAILALYAILIPPFSGMGAAWATLGGFLVRFVFFLRYSQKLWPVAWNWRQSIRLATIATLAVVACVLRAPTGYVSQIAIATGVFLLYAGTVWKLVLDASERRLLLGLARAPRQALAAMTSA